MKSTDVKPELRKFLDIIRPLLWQVDVATFWQDFLLMSVTQFATPDEQIYKDDHRQALHRYQKEEHKQCMRLAFHEMLQVYSRGIEQHGWHDPLGDIYMALASTSKQSALGQYFTPEHICELMTRMLKIGIEEDDPSKTITMNEPTCGSGRMVLAAHTQAMEKQRKITFVAQDMDYICCLMTVLNMLMHGCRGIVVWGDTLMVEHRRSWRVNTYLHNHEFPFHEPELLQYPQIAHVPHLLKGFTHNPLTVSSNEPKQLNHRQHFSTRT